MLTLEFAISIAVIVTFCRLRSALKKLEVVLTPRKF